MRQKTYRTTCAVLFSLICMVKFSSRICAESIPRRFGGDIYSYITAPLSWSGSDITALAMTGGGALCLLMIDDRARRIIQNNKSAMLDATCSYAKHFGDGRILMGVSAAFAVKGALCNNSRDYDVAWSCVESFLFAGFVNVSIQQLFGRKRPIAGDNALDSFTGPHIKTYDRAFPSGHAMAAFSCASVIAEYHDELWVDILAYTVASGTAFSRVYHDRHWLSDIFMGSAIGIFTGRWVARRNMKNPLFADRISLIFEEDMLLALYHIPF